MGKKRRWLRRLLFAGLAVLGLALVASALALWALRSPRAQQALVERVSRRTEAAMGFAVEADALRLRPVAGALEIEGLRLRVPGGAPFSTASRLRLRWRPAGLLSKPVALEALEIDQPVFDLGAPLPAAGAESAAGEPSDLPLRIGRLEISEGRVIGSAVGETFNGWSLGELALAGALGGDGLEIERLAGLATVVPAWRQGDPMTVGVELEGAARLEGVLDVERLTLAGEGLSGVASGRAGPALASSTVTFDLEADPGRWLLDQPSGPVGVRGDLNLATWEGRLELEAGDQPGTLARGFVSDDLADRLELDRSVLGLRSELRLTGDRVVSGDVRLTASRSGAEVFIVEARPRLELIDALPVEVALTVTLLPASAGTRRLTADVHSAEARRLGAWRVEQGLLIVREGDLGRRVAGLSALYPRLLDASALPDLSPLEALGPVDTESRFHGLLTDPTVAAKVRLRPDPASRIEVTAAGRPLSGSVRATTTGRGVELGLFAPDLAGRVDWRGTVEDVLGSARGELELTTGPVVGESGEIVESIAARLRGDRGRVAWGIEARRADGVGVEGSGEVEPELPLGRAHGELKLETGDPRVTRIDGTFDLDGGVLTTRASAALAGRDPLVVDARVPLAALDAAAPLAALSELPLVRGDGPIELEWRAESGSWLEVLPPDLESRFGRLDAGTSGRLDLDLACPACSALRATVDGIGLELDGRRMTPADLKAELSDGDLRLEEWRLDGPGLELSARAMLALDRGWRLGDDFAALAVELDANFAGELDSDWLESSPLAPLGPRALQLHAGIGGPFDELGGTVEIAAPGLPVIDRVALPFALDKGLLRIDDGVISSVGGDGALRLELPVDGRAEGVARLAWDLPVNDWTPLVHRMTESEDPEVLEGALHGALELPLEDPAALALSAFLDQARVVVRGRETRIEPALELTVRDGEVRVPPVTLSSSTETFTFRARADLDREWTPAAAATALIASFSIAGEGGLDSGLLNPFLAGGRAEGPLGVDLEVEGTPADWDGRVVIDGPEASLVYRGTYLVRIDRPRFELAVADGTVALERGSAFVNEGEATLSGVLWDGTATDLSIGLKDALFRLDYGLLATIGADLRLQATGLDALSLSGAVDLERGALTRSLRPDLDFLSEFLAPVDLTTTEESLLDHLALDLEIGTREGVRIDNNLAEMLVRWEPLVVTGSAARPVIAGRLEADPGGLLFLYGQTVRLDRAAIEYPGIENAEARLDFEATTSLEDPTIGRLAGDDPFRSTGRRAELGQTAEADATGDLARYLGDSVAGRLGAAVGVEVSLRPVLIFGEADPGARLTVGRDLSPNLTVTASVDLREAEAQTYLLEVHELDALPRLVGQVFSDDESNYGAVLLQRQEFGGTQPATRRDLPRVGKIVVEAPRGISRRAVRRATGLARGEPFDATRRFAVEVELIDFLRRDGYADAEVSIQPATDSQRPRRVRLEVTIKPGPQARFEFEGEKLSKPLRRLIADLYRPDFFEPESLTEMEIETVRALRSRGFLEPRVEIEVEPLDPEAPTGDRRVTIRSVGGARISRDPPVFLGVTAEEVAVLDALFFNTVQRVELAVGLESADRRLLRALAGLGYPDARIVARYQSLDKRVLTVEVEPGPRLRIEDVAVGYAVADVIGASPEVPSLVELERLVTVAAGDPLRNGELARSALAIERELGARGHLAARARPIVGAAESGDAYARRVRFEVEPGPVSRLAEVRFTGLGSTRESWARERTGLRPGGTLAAGDLADARSTLWRTGLFSAVSTRTLDAEPDATVSIFDVAERPRYQMAYGVRWDSETGVGAVFDVTDGNFRGRGWTLGLRALSSSEEDSVRALTRVPRVFGGPGSLELFLSASEITDSAFDLVFGRTSVVDEILEGTIQYSHPIGARSTIRLYGRYTDTESRALFVTEEITDPALGLQFLYDSRTPEPVTRRGTFASVDLSGSEDFLGGDLRYARLFSQLNLHRPVRSGRSGLTWSQAYRLGLAEAFDQVLIRDVRFFAGGEYSVRGYATESLGPQGGVFTTGGAVGGAALLVMNQELRWRLLDDYTLVGFVDAGEIWSDIGDLDLDLRFSAGLGLRAVTPVGLVRLDLAHALDRRPEIDPDFKLYVGLGTVF